MSIERQNGSHSVGRAIPGIKVSIAEDGEILAAGQNISPGYWPVTTGKKQRLLHTGDIGYLDEHDLLHITGRKKNLVVFSTGDKIQLEDIEYVAKKAFPHHEFCAATGVVSGEIIVVFTGELNHEKLIKALNKELPLFARIRKVIQWPEQELPKTNTLKVKRDVIQQFLQS